MTVRLMNSSVPNNRDNREKEPITYRKLMEKALLGAHEALEGLSEIGGDYGNDPRDRIAAYKGLVEAYSKLANLAEVEGDLAAFPVLQAISASSASSK